MNKGLDRIVWLFALYCLSSAVTVTSLLQVARAQEALPPRVPHVPGAHIRQILIADQGTDAAYGKRIVIFTNVPMLGELFQSTCGPTGCEEMLRRVGVDPGCAGTEECRVGEIDVHACGDFPHLRQATVLSRVLLRPGEIIDTREVRNSERRLKASALFQGIGESHEANERAAFLHLGCPCGATGECTCASHTSAGSECSAAGCTGCNCDNCQCEACQCTACPGKAAETRCGGEDCNVATMVIHGSEHEEELVDHHPLKLLQHIASLMAEKAAAEATLEAREEAHEQIAELFEAMAEVMADNAALDAKLQAQAEHTGLLEKLSDLAAENARLKAHVELAAERAELAKNTLSLALENERLKMRLALLEEHRAADAARTAARPQNDREHR